MVICGYLSVILTHNKPSALSRFGILRQLLMADHSIVTPDESVSLAQRGHL
jgi:hypothetical protein